ncbi:hypothetical protein BGZ51_002163 [Haplosporangium sp. Z 767]|nr:hypothetical protein BGZ50_005847 [Haplosporangium sp. Z 11]KAF9193840.1 hypothetical protein BGZ51_002163 [Haplosporangium sp. Z 767]
MKLNTKSAQALSNLQNHPPEKDNFKTNKRSAVLIALLANSQGDLEVIITVRSSTLRTNAGDCAFPGGKQDPEDKDLITTAKREAFEEVRLDPSKGDLLTILTPVLSRHMLVVTPVVAFYPDMTTADLGTLIPNPGEVAAIFTSPLESFLSPNPNDYAFFDMDGPFTVFRIHRFMHCGTENYVLGDEDVDPVPSTSTSTSAPNSVSVSGSDSDSDRPLPADALDQEKSRRDRRQVGWQIYGMTAGLLVEVARIAYQREPDFIQFAPDQNMDQDQYAEWYNQHSHTRGFHSML